MKTVENNPDLIAHCGLYGAACIDQNKNPGLAGYANMMTRAGIMTLKK